MSGFLLDEEMLTKTNIRVSLGMKISKHERAIEAADGLGEREDDVLAGSVMEWSTNELADTNISQGSALRDALAEPHRGANVSNKISRVLAARLKGPLEPGKADRTLECN